MADRAPLVLASGRFQQQQAADTLAIPGPVSTPNFYQVGEIATPATPASGFGRLYAKSDGKLYFLNDGGTEVDLSAGTSIGTAIGSSTVGSVLFIGAGSVLAQDNANFFWDDTNNRLGLGTSTPGNVLHVVGDARITTTLQVDGSTTLGDAAGDTLTINGTAVSVPNNLNFDSNTLFIDAANNRVGAGTATPAQALDVVGNVKSSGFYEVAEIATPATPASGSGRIYAKTNGLPYFLNDGGVEYDLTADVIAGQTTTGLADGDFGYVSAANTWTKAQNDGTQTQATVISCNEGVAGQMALPGSVIENAKFTTAGGSPAVGSLVWLAAAADDGGTGAGKLTATAPTAGGSYLVIVGVCIDDANYAGSKTAKIIFNPAAPVLL